MDLQIYVGGVLRAQMPEYGASYLLVLTKVGNLTLRERTDLLEAWRKMHLTDWDPVKPQPGQVEENSVLIKWL